MSGKEGLLAPEIALHVAVVVQVVVGEPFEGCAVTLEMLGGVVSANVVKLNCPEVAGLPARSLEWT